MSIPATLAMYHGLAYAGGMWWYWINWPDVPDNVLTRAVAIFGAVCTILATLAVGLIVLFVLTGALLGIVSALL